MYLDSAATSQKPRIVINAIKGFYEKHNANIHRGLYDLSQRTTELFEQTRKKVAEFIGGDDPREIIFTSNTTESINLVAEGWAKKFLKKDDIVVLSEMEHNSNVVPWLRLQEEIGIKLFFLSLTNDGRLDYSKIPEQAKLITLTHASNVLGTINPVSELRKFAPEAKILIDAAQSIPHLPIDINKLDCDFLVFSSHKLFGPSGVGVLWGKKQLLEQMDPLLVGSHMVKKVTKEKAVFADIPDRFESGTRNLEGVIGLGAAVDYLQEIGMKKIQQHEKELTKYALEKLQKISGLQLFGPRETKERLGIFSFSVGNVHPHDVAEILNRSQIAVRSGHHCAHVLMQSLGVPATVRASFSIYNTKEDVDQLVAGIEKVKKTFKI